MVEDASLGVSTSLNCKSCQYAKLHRVHLSPRVNNQAFAPFELVHSDVWGPCPIVSPTGFQYFVTFIDDYSRVIFNEKPFRVIFSLLCLLC